MNIQLTILTRVKRLTPNFTTETSYAQFINTNKLNKHNSSLKHDNTLIYARFKSTRESITPYLVDPDIFKDLAQHERILQ